MERNQENGEVQVEQITKTPGPVAKKPNKPKDPKKVAAGKALARKNKEAREAAAAAVAKQEDHSIPVFLSFDNVQKAAALVGAGFTLYHGWAAVTGELGKRFGKKSEEDPEAPKQEGTKNVKAQAKEPSIAEPATLPSAIKGIDMD